MISSKIMEYAVKRGVEKTFCPSEVARELFPENWCEKMEMVREVADDLVQENKIVVLQNGVIRNDLPSKLKGPIRLRQK